MFKVLLPAAAALGLIVLAARPGTAEPADPPSAEAGMHWNVHYEGALAKLTYGVPHSDQLALMVTCMPGDSQAVVYGDVQPAGARMIQARQVIDPLSAGDAVNTHVLISDPWLAELAERGRMTVVGDEGRFQLRANIEGRRLVAGFLSYCAPGRV